MDCSHKNTVKRPVSETFLGESFGFETYVCQDCGAVLWTPDAIAAFESFKKDVSKRQKDRLKIQKILLTNESIEFIDEYVAAYAVDFSKVVKAMLATYFEFVEKVDALKALFAEIKIPAEKFERGSVRVPLSLYESVNGWSEVFNMTMGQYTGEVLNKMV